jgi:hypothetical protein
MLRAPLHMESGKTDEALKPVIEYISHRSDQRFPVTGPMNGPGLSKSCSFFALDGERWCRGDRITWDGKAPPTAVDLRAGTEFPGFHGG